MSRLTLRLPESLHNQLKETAKREGVSLNQYVVYALAQKTAPDFSFRRSDKTIKQQMEAFYAYLDNVPQATDAEVRTFLEARAEAEPDIDADTLARFEALLR